MFSHLHRRIPILLCALCIAGLAEAGDRPVVASDLLRLRSVTSIDVAADGSQAVLAVSSIETIRSDPAGEAEYAYRSHLFLVNLFAASAEPRQLTWGARSDRAPALSPRGSRIAFIRPGVNADGSVGPPQVWIMPTDGGEARQLTDLPHGASTPCWSPDGTRLLVTSYVPFDDLPGEPAWPGEKPGRDWNDVNLRIGYAPNPDGTIDEIRAWLDANAGRADPFVVTDLNYQNESSLRTTRRFSHLFILDPDDERTTGTQITSGFFNHDDAAFMPDGRSVIYAASKSIDAHPDRVDDQGLWRVNIDGTNDREILSLEGWAFSSPMPGRDGAVIGLKGVRTDEPEYRLSLLGIASISDTGLSEPVWLTDPQTLDSGVWRTCWMPTRSALLFNTLRRGGMPLMMTSPGLLEPAALVAEQHGMPVNVWSFDAGGGALVYAVAAADNPCTLRVTDGHGDRLLMDLNPWIEQKKLSLPREGWLTRPDGTRIQYWIMEPTEPVEGRRYPLVAEIHGGPQWMWGPPAMWHEFQLLCSRGYGVVFCNPRGSAGYGYDFQKAGFQNWGEGPAGDVLAAVDQAMLQDWVDPDRLFVTGGSYGGFLSAWIISHDHRFKAAVSQRGVYDMATFFGEGHQWRMVPETLGGYPWDARFRDIVRRESPFTYVSRIRTPLLILHSADDLRVGDAQAQMMYRALKALNRPVEFVLYPNADHGLSRRGEPRQRMDRLNRIVEFFERYKGGG